MEDIVLKMDFGEGYDKLSGETGPFRWRRFHEKTCISSNQKNCSGNRE